MTCQNCAQPIESCDDDYEGHKCDGWRHADGFHGCDPRHNRSGFPLVSSTTHAVPASGAAS